MTNQTAVSQTFHFQESHDVRIQVINGEPVFCLLDVAKILDIKNTKASRFNLSDAGVHKMYLRSGGQKRELTFIDEPNLYRVIFRSNKKEAVEFQNWVFEEVLPTIRKTGEYRKPEGSVEKLTNKDMENLSYLVKVMSSGFRFKDCASAGIWHALRAVTQTPSPNRFTVEDLPVLAEECKRIMAITSAFHKSVFSAEKEIVRKVMRGNKDAEAILLEIDNEFESIVQSRELDFSAIGKFENNLLASLSVKN